MKKLSWQSHKNHYEILKEFYALNKYLITEQLKDTLLDAIECMNYVMDMNENKELNKELIDSFNPSKITIAESMLKNCDLHSYDNLVEQILNGNNCISKEVILNYLLETKNMYLDSLKEFDDINLNDIDSRQHSMSFTHGLIAGLELAIRFINN